MTPADSFDSPDGRTYSGPPLPPLPPRWTGKYRKRPVEVEAVQLINDLRNHTEVAAWIEGNGGHAEIPFAEPCLFIETLEGTVRADIGWWVVRGVKGEFYAVRPDIFAETYEPAPAVTADTLPAAGIEVTHEPEIPVHLVQLRLCALCLDGVGGECHTPGCALWINRAPDLPLRDSPFVKILPGPCGACDGSGLLEVPDGDGESASQQACTDPVHDGDDWFEVGDADAGTSPEPQPAPGHVLVMRGTIALRDAEIELLRKQQARTREEAGAVRRKLDIASTALCRLTTAAYPAEARVTASQALDAMDRISVRDVAAPQKP